jgi:hypothetical protein
MEVAGANGNTTLGVRYSDIEGRVHRNLLYKSCKIIPEVTGVRGALKQCQGRSKTRPVRRSKSRPLDSLEGMKLICGALPT